MRQPGGALQATHAWRIWMNLGLRNSGHDPSKLAKGLGLRFPCAPQKTCQFHKWITQRFANKPSAHALTGLAQV